MTPTRVWVSWSSGKDSTFALRAARNDPSLEVVGLLTTLNGEADREATLAGTGIEPLFPLWQQPTRSLAHEMIEASVRAVLTCVDPSPLPAAFAGRSFDADLLGDLPAGVDHCGENGEFHTFVWNGPGFSAPVDVEAGEVVERDGFVFCDVLPA